jgi:hypothetical protein
MKMTWLVIRFNWHFFAIALVSCIAAIGLMVVVESLAVRLLLAAGIGLAVYFMVASVMAAYCVYDASDLYRLHWWPARCMTAAPEHAVLVHAGFDPASAAILAKFPRLQLRVLDFFDPATTTETSIQRAHRLNPAAGSEERIAPDSWPVASGSQDVVFALSAAHELRKPEQRAALFREARRVLRDGGKVIVIEQLRNLANFACFGVAAFHFLARRTWYQSFMSARLTVSDEFHITPFMTAFVLRPNCT